MNSLKIPSWEEADELKNTAKYTPLHHFVRVYEPSQNIEAFHELLKAAILHVIDTIKTPEL